jgi:FkbM family methyltransferase
MPNVIIDFAAKHESSPFSMSIEHPAGVTLPIDGQSDASLITPEVRGEIRSGGYGSDLLRQLPAAVKPDDRVLLIGAGLGIVSTLIARIEGVERVIAAEPNAALIDYLDRVHNINGVSGVETINAVLAVGMKGRIQYCVQRDLRTVSLMPHDQSRQQAMTVPFMDLNLILAEERISLIICDTPTAPTQLLAQAELGLVDRILLNCGNDVAACRERDRVCTQLAAHGFYAERSQAPLLFRRSAARRGGSTRISTPANWNSAPVLVQLG